MGKPPLQIPWKAEKHLGETSESDGYTSGWSDREDSDSVPSYFVTEFSGATEEDFGFSNPIPEEGCQDIEEPGNEVLRPEDRSLGTTDVPLMLKWIQGQVAQGSLPAIGLKEHQQDTSWSEIRARTEESELDLVKNIVSPTDYEKMEVETGKTFYLGRTLNEEEKSAYSELLKEFADVFAWSPSDLIGIPATLGEHQIDLVNEATPVRQRQYRLNPRYSLMVKEEIDRLLEAGFIYPVSNSEWVSPIVVLPKKMGADGKVKIRVCQDFRKLNAATKKDYFPLPFMDIILDHVAGQECYSFLDGFSGYNQVFIRVEDQVKTTFTTEWGTFAFNRMPFRLCNAPGTFQRLMMDIFQDFLRHFLEVSSTILQSLVSGPSISDSSRKLLSDAGKQT